MNCRILYYSHEYRILSNITCMFMYIILYFITLYYIPYRLTASAPRTSESWSPVYASMPGTRPQRSTTPWSMGCLKHGS